MAIKADRRVFLEAVEAGTYVSRSSRGRQSQFVGGKDNMSCNIKYITCGVLPEKQRAYLALTNYQ
jgi:hypothetical protein